MLLVPGSLKFDPGDVAALPGVLVTPFFPHSTPWSVSAYTGAAPITAMATMQLAENSLYLIIDPPFPGTRKRAPYLGHGVGGPVVQRISQVSCMTDPGKSL